MSLIRFSSKAAGEVFMFEEHARQLFDILGKDATPKGIVTADQVPEALARLKAAVDTEKRLIAQARAKAKAPAGADEVLPDGQPVVHLGQRAFPLIDMLEQAQKKHADVLWGV